MIDAHHHIWLQKDLPWLLGPEQPRIFGPYRAIMRDYTLSEYMADTAGTGITKSVYVQANWAPNWFADEVAWVQSEADAHGMIAGIVGYADMTQGDVRQQLDKLKPYPLMRGIRHQFHWHENPLYRFASDPDLCRDATVQQNVARLADYGWTFDLQVFPGQMEGAAELARACPEVTFILQHAGMKEDTSAAGHKAWLDGMKRLADCPNVVTKLSAFGTFIHRNDPAFIEEMITSTEKIFGADRCMYGSNFPIEKLWTSYTELFNAFRDGAKGLSKKKQSAIFNDTAARVYRL
ncbi:amidohydrolase family protein [Frigidibacter sp. ROC022]|uniref:amidohydrolase family protein n=1 Tax=Frigidibacter sp. ROC022 TaxID=2971796 RepID=UPI00215A61FE|nr:amidohydrolase family protein [Frigidibacter sp. ROC022]MCR8725765.1 amidohydrolase family protein [Frigidibacter sp. ROC022]